MLTTVLALTASERWAFGVTIGVALMSSLTSLGMAVAAARSSRRLPLRDLRHRAYAEVLSACNALDIAMPDYDRARRSTLDGAIGDPIEQFIRAASAARLVATVTVADRISVLADRYQALVESLSSTERFDGARDQASTARKAFVDEASKAVLRSYGEQGRGDAHRRH